MVNLLLTRTPKSFSEDLLSSRFAPTCSGAWGYSFPGVGLYTCPFYCFHNYYFYNLSLLILTLPCVLPADVNECEAEPCKNGGICTDLVANYSCECPGEFMGRNCQQSKYCMSLRLTFNKINQYFLIQK